ncbi:MAG: transketolase [Fastidiosipilaceae bacterium]|jgi:transketolase|nr:transketolase [Clostridiaceae bacterium]
MDRKELLELQKFATQIRIETVKQVGIRGFGHLGGALSIADALAVLYGKVMNIRPDDPKWADRDVMVCSKGHAGPAVYSTLALKGYFPMEMLETLNQPGTKLPSHCDRNLTPGVDMTTGSLGQGVSTALGMALAQKLDNKDSKTYLFIGDGECNEGQVWEGAMFAHQHKLGNLVAFVDDNGKQLDGYTKDVMDVGNIAAKFESFGWDATTIDGHDIEAIVDAIEAALKVTDKPSCIVLKTVKGKGVKDLEDMMLNHHVRIDDDFTNKGLAELEEVMAGIEKELANV